MIPSRLGQRVALSLVKVVLAFMVSMVLPPSSRSQSIRERPDTGNSRHARTNSREDSLHTLKPSDRPLHLGLDVSMGTPRYQLESNIDELNNLPINYFGGMAGGVLANPAGKIKGGIGIYFSGDNVPYKFDLLTANLSMNLYLLPIKEVRYHTWEPYIFSGISQMKSKFYGRYLSDPSAKIRPGSAEDLYIGSVISTHLLAGAGVEYQLENNNRDFIHMYAEISFGSNVRRKTTTDGLSDSIVPDSSGSQWG